MDGGRIVVILGIVGGAACIGELRGAGGWLWAVALFWAGAAFGRD